MSLASSLRKSAKSTKRQEPLWKGPEEDGITFSLLSRFLVCRERFRLLVVEGLKPFDAFSHRLEFGQMWHVCEEALAGNADVVASVLPTWQPALTRYCQELCKRYPLQQDEINKWYHVCKVQFPIYVKHWSHHPDVKDRTPLLQEQVFDVPYKLPSGRMVRLRGKWDSIDLIGKGKNAGVYIQENKTKSRIDERQMKRQLTFDLQTMMYLTALQEVKDWDCDSQEHITACLSKPILGVRYNVIKRTEHRVTKKETLVDFAEKVKRAIEEDPSHWFMRWKVEVGAADIARFRRECLDPILEQLCDWWEWINLASNPFDMRYDSEGKTIPTPHWRHPYGIFNPMDEGGVSDLDSYLETGSEVGLRRTDQLFPELQ